MIFRRDAAFINDADGARALETPHLARRINWTVLALFAIGIVWAHFATLEEVTRGEARVIPSQQLQVVQVLDPGIVEEIGTHEGDVVDAGQVLMRVNDTGSASQLGEVRQRRYALLARIARLDAEARGADAPVYPAELRQAAEAAIQPEENLFRARKDKFQQDVVVLQQQLIQRRQEYEELKGNVKKLEATLQLSQREYDLYKRLQAQKVVPEIEMLKTERQLVTGQAELDVLRKSVPRAEAAIAEAEERVRNADTTFRAQAREDLAKSQADLAVIDETIKAAEDRVTRTVLRAPVHGIVNKVYVTTVGAVVQPGHTIIEIVPLDDSLLIETKIRPQDVAFIRPDQKATIKISAYDYSIYGTLSGHVDRISADTTVTEKGETFYRVIVRADKNSLGTAEHPLPIIPGMVATVDILTGQKTVLDYLLKPIIKARYEALRER